VPRNAQPSSVCLFIHLRLNHTHRQLNDINKLFYHSVLSLFWLSARKYRDKISTAAKQYVTLLKISGLCY